MSPRPPSSLLRRALLAMCVLLALPASAADLVTFSRGSLIIPENATFQQGCGSLSAYGLVWRILQANQPGGFNANNPVTVYLAINDQKTSPNRCVPTNRHTAPAPANDDRWNDGCDFTITNTKENEQPVVPVNYGVPFPASGVYPNAAIENFTTTATQARPYFTAVTLNHTVANPRFTTARYSGGAFIIAAEDAKNAIEFIRSGSGDLSPEKFRTTCARGCATFTNNSGCHHVRMHQATIEFTAPVARRINRVPPKIALLDLSDGFNSAGDPLVKGGMLDDYLRNAGLDFPGAGGCPEGTTSGCTLNGKKPGLIYDALHANADLVSTATFKNGLLNAVDPVTKKPRYKVFWAPHWEIGNITRREYVPNGDGATTQRENALNNVEYFTNQRGNGLFAECASIWSYEATLKPDRTPVLSSRFQAESGFQINQLSGGRSWDGRNCTDPDYMAQAERNRGQCVIYPNAGDPFSQMGDFRFNNVVGHTENYRATYKDGVRRLAVSWYGHKDEHVYDNATHVGQDARRGHDFFTFNQKDNDPKKATVVYLAGHDFKSSVPGTRIVLNTLLNLGSEPLSNERALSAPVAFEDPNGSDGDGSRALVMAATYDAVRGYPPGADTFLPTQGSHWVFPYYPGHLRAHSLIGGNALATGESALDEATLWDADTVMPHPRERNLFTYFGGQVKENPSLGTGLRAPRGVLQVGWKPQNVAGTAINANYGSGPNPHCVDVLKLGEVKNPDDTSRFDFVTTPTGDGVCDLQQAVQFTEQLAGTDFGQSTAAINKAKLANDFNAVAQMLQRVRGFCYATSTGNDGSGSPVLEPSDSQCNNEDAENRARLGGFVHSSPAVVKPSGYIPDKVAPRPTVAYAAGLDGQLHAFYVSGGARYAGPAENLSFPNVSPADTAFPKNWSASFQSGSTPPPGTELWSFLPATQLPWLRSNAAAVNSAPVVLDVFADFVGSGKREWHTVLVANAGQKGRDLFALDITNPLRPVLLWHLVGSHFQAGSFPPHAPVELADRDTGGTQWAWKWREETAHFVMAPLDDPGRHPTGLYNYTEMGGTRGLSVGVVRQGLEPTYTVFVGASSSGAQGSPTFGMQVFAIDIATGQKLWQWERGYTQAWVDNTPPHAPTVLTDTGGAARVYTGDMEGKLWELDGATGQNVNVARANPPCATPCKFTGLDAQSVTGDRRPLSTNVALARLPQNITAGSALKNYEGELVALVGTGGVDWVPADDAGQLHLALLGTSRRLPLGTAGLKLDGTNISASEAKGLATQQGILQEPTPFPLTFGAPQHVYGTITVAGRTAYFSTANGKIGSDLMSVEGNISGKTWALDLGNTATSGTGAVSSLSSMTVANFGGVAVFQQGSGASSQSHVIGLGVSKIARHTVNDPAGANTPEAKEQMRVNGQNGFVFRLLNWSQRFFE